MTMDYWLWTMDYWLWTMDYGLWTMDYCSRLPSLDCTGCSTLCHCGNSFPSKAFVTTPMSPQIFHLPKLTVWNYFELLYSLSHKRHIKIILEMHNLDINHTKICLKLAQIHGYDDLWAKSMKNLLLTAFNPSLVWWCCSFKSCCYTDLGLHCTCGKGHARVE